MTCPHLVNGVCGIAAQHLQSFGIARPPRPHALDCQFCVASGGPGWNKATARLALASAADRKAFSAEHRALLIETPAPPPPKPPQPKQVGDLLADRLASKWKTLPCQRCHELASRMNEWGPAACRERLDAIVADIRPRALKWAARDATWRQLLEAAGEAALHGGIDAAIRAEVVAAIDAAEGRNRPFPEDVTICLPTFQRRDKLTACLQSIQRCWPSAAVIVADNGTEGVDPAAVAPGLDVTYLRLPFDVGISAARNTAFRATRQGCRYVLLMEDDFVVDERANVDVMRAIMEAHPDIGVVGGDCEWSYRGKSMGGAHRLEGAAVRTAQDLPTFTLDGAPFQLCEWVYNWALFRRELLDTNPWDERWKIAEHTPFYLDLKHSGRWLVAWTPASRIGHVSDKDDSAEYAAARGRGATEYSEIDRVYPPELLTPSRIAVPNPRCVLVIGTGRSGTSWVASMLSEAGVMMGHAMVPADATNPRGFFEDATFHAAISSGADVSDLVAMRNATQPAWGVKNPRIASAWERLRSAPWPADTRVVVCRRMEAGAVDSYRRAYGATLAEGEDWFRRRTDAVEAMLADVSGRGWPVLTVEFETLHEREADVRDSLLSFTLRDTPYPVVAETSPPRRD